MSGLVRRRPRARADLIDTADYLQQQSVLVAAQYLTAAERSITLLSQMPGLGSPWESEDPALADIRFAPIDGFKSYLIFYRPLSDGIEIIRILHGATDLERLLAAR
jgi:toxin ParE1/3/4